MKTSDAFNVKHIVPYCGNSSLLDSNDLDSRVNFLRLGENNAIGKVEQEFFARSEHPKLTRVN